MRKAKRQLRGAAEPACRGFTLVESMAAVVVLATLGSIASFLIVDTVEQCMDATTSAQLHAELAVAVERSTREIRKIELDAGEAGVAPDITAVTSTLLQWEDSGGDDYELSLAGSNLRLQVDGGSLATLLTDVTAFTVYVYDEDNTALGLPLSGPDCACDTIRRVRLDLTVQRGGITESFRTRADIRSTMYGAE